MSDWSVINESGSVRNPVTHHLSPDSRSWLRVTHVGGDPKGHYVEVWNGDGEKKRLNSWTDSEHARLESIEKGRTRIDIGPPPSPELQSLIESHHENQAWAPLLDKLVEEYPEHFDEAVREHTAARQSSDAAQYARAFTATKRT